MIYHSRNNSVVNKSSIYTNIHPEVHKCFQKIWKPPQILSAKKVTYIKPHNYDPHILGATVQNLAVMAT
jgi:hypothetical protein